MMGEYKGHPVVVDQDVVGTGKVVCTHLKKQFSWYETVVGMNEMYLYRWREKRQPNC